MNNVSCNHHRDTCPYLKYSTKQYIRHQLASIIMKNALLRKNNVQLYKQSIDDTNKIKELQWAIQDKDSKITELTNKMNFYKHQLEIACSD